MSYPVVCGNCGGAGEAWYPINERDGYDLKTCHICQGNGLKKINASLQPDPEGQKRALEAAIQAMYPDLNQEVAFHEFYPEAT